MYEKKAISFYQSLLFLLPKPYRKRFGQEMLLVFADIYQEELEKKGKVGFFFWLTVFDDFTKCLLTQHLDMIKKQGLKNYLHINPYNIIGAIFLLPFFGLFGIDFLGRIVQSDFSHNNRTWSAVLSSSFLYSEYFGRPLLLWTTLVLFPVLSILINLIPFFSISKGKNTVSLKTIFFVNPGAFVIVAGGLFCLLVVFGHDFIPCMFQGFFLKGLFHFDQILAFCKNA